MRLFWADLALALRASAAAPMLPLLSVALVLPSEASLLLRNESQVGISVALNWVGVACGVFSVGWVGTQRIWFQRLFDHGTLAPTEVWRLSWMFFGRYFVLGLAVGLPGFVILTWFFYAVIQRHAVGEGVPEWWLPFWLLYTFVLDVALTFVTPALAFTTPKVRTAVAIGIGMIRYRWPESAPYALTPAIALLALATFVQSSASWQFVLVIASTLIALELKGAIAAYYLRVAPST